MALVQSLEESASSESIWRHLRGHHGISKTSFNVPARITDHPSTPTESKVTSGLLYNDVAVEHSGRGIQLTVNEQQCLISLCRNMMDHYELGHYPKSFWIRISAALQEQTGRRYSWQSCRRRIIGYITKRKAYWAAYKYNHIPECDMHSEVADDVDSWMGSCDRKLGRPVRHEVALKAAEKPEEAPPLRGSVQQLIKYTRVSNWVESLPPPAEMDPLPTKFGIPSLSWCPPFSSHQSFSHTQSPSQSPVLNEISMYRQRAGAPRGIHLAPSNTPSYRGQPTEQQERPKLSPLTNGAVQPQASPGVVPETSHNTQAGNKRPRDDDDNDDAAHDRPAHRLRQDEPSHPSATITLNQESALNGTTAVDSSVENTFGKLWERVAPLFKDPVLAQGPAALKSESIMRDLFSEIGTALTKAFTRMREDNDEPEKI
ncbi:hypothetical protein F9C07_895 [Aspergillus flavus]|uniref:Uncharacterized protein n=3 Tax=Aspergillus subgen. Circumdati TaxID=2720871 RepID=B8MYH6_ASPFN|nr:uncharacterized protein G4B84_001279 [Aspergillus flavus NRRL3357]EIT80062.1 hypothetical protein Ao3042_03436 [Aspergillus oryzae 3.042]KAB8246687.1 hypothetical protein BDV35DRAFT_218458 [Aspergillus flavus]KDE81541.1 hypothetical protein AO1008_08151 [Aspergillus oryzae 100-8]KOC14233.1 hypothetical protein AFLA70_154g002670 [Aspergillus flavus AF70]GMF73551.1 unnamed protein product [Aspergillus oryzae]|eukprot:EIT80062.1 hypothetical protein Ao3042_03436 [Aspergillus oryzae 3.042]